MKVLLDTHIFIWAISGDDRLSLAHRAAFQNPNCELILSVASVWEMLIKYSVGKLSIPSPATRFIIDEMERTDVSVLQISRAHLAELEMLPMIHRDPFDRMLVAQAKSEQMPILTDDREIKKYDVALL